MERKVDVQTDAGNGGRMLTRAPELRDRLRQIDEDLRTFVEQRPLLALGVAVAAGYLTARLTARLLGR